MEKIVKWTKNNLNQLVSEDGSISVYKESDHWVMKDGIDLDLLQFDNRENALDTGGMRVLISSMGNFYPFLKVAVKSGDLKIIHQIF